MPDQDVELCFASQHFFPLHGGGTLRFMRYFPGLRQRGIHTRVVTGTPKSSKWIDTDFTREWRRYAIGETIPAEPIDGTPIHRIRLPEEKGWRRLILFNREIVRFCRQPGYSPHVVQIFQAIPHRSLPWLRRLRRRGIAVAYAYTAPAKLPTPPLKRMIRRWALRELSRHLDCIIAGSAAMGRHAHELGFRSRIDVIPNGVDLTRFHPNHDNAQCHQIRASLGMDDQSIMIATVGSVIPGKGCDLILEAWTSLAQRFPQAHCVIVGARFDPDHYQKGEFEKKIASLIAASGAGDRVHFTGHVDDIELYYRACDIFVFPTQKEGMPNVVLEAMASALPVILTPFPTLSEDLGRPGRDFLLIERHPQALSSAVERLIRDAEYRSDLGRSGRRWVEQTMDLDHVLDRYAALYRELAHRPM
jgi:glycosyltransferase involved in cell wall biosynthesis